jgi:DNA invertase Pin-like site-specific DNA recombinase
MNKRRQRRQTISDLAGLRCAPYLRVSRADQQDKHQLDAERSTSTQRRIYGEWAPGAGVVTVDEYSDPDMSASAFRRKKNRPQFERLCGDIRAGKIDVVWFWRISRQQRDLIVFAEIRDLCREHAVLWVLRDRISDPANSGDMFAAAIETLIAEKESADLSEAVYDGKESGALKGKRAGRIPYGYRKGDYDPASETFGPDQPDVRDGDPAAPAAVVREIFGRLHDGESLTSLRRDLNRRGVPSAAGKQWVNSTVRRIALSPTYAGLRVYQRDQHDTLEAAILEAEPKWPPLVDQDKFWAVYRLLTDPARRKTRPRHGTHLLSSIARCAKCGGKLIRKIAGTGREAYICKEYACVGIDKAALDAYVSERIVAWLSDPQVAASLQSGSDSEAARLSRAEISRARADLEDWVQLAERGEVSALDFARIAKAKRELIASAEQRLAEAYMPPVLVGSVGQQASAGWDATDITVKRQIVAEVAAIEVCPVGRAHGAGGAVPPVYRVRWTWKLGPGNGVTIEPLSWEEHRAELAELREQRARRRDYVSAERREAITRLLRDDPELADREIARRVGRVDRHAIRHLRHELEAAQVIPVIRRPDRWHVVNHGYATTGRGPGAAPAAPQPPPAAAPDPGGAPAPAPLEGAQAYRRRVHKTSRQPAGG